MSVCLFMNICVSVSVCSAAVLRGNVGEGSSRVSQTTERRQQIRQERLERY